MNPSEVMWLNHSCGVRSSTKRSLRSNASHGRSCRMACTRSETLRRSTVTASVQPSSNASEMNARPVGQATKVTNNSKASHIADAAPAPRLDDTTSDPTHVLGNHCGASGKRNVERSPLALAMPEKLKTQNVVGTMAPSSHRNSFA